MINLKMTPLLWYLLIIFASIIDANLDDIKYIYHPVQFIGNLIKYLEKLLNRNKARKFKGFLLVIITLTVVFLVSVGLEIFVSSFGIIVYFFFNLWFLSTALCEKSLFLAAKKVKDDLNNNNIEQARRDCKALVGRDTANLSRAEIIRAVVESEAENFIDGIFAPLFFMLVGLVLSIFNWLLNPLTLVYLYKTINTLDSMVGYNFEPYTEFGYYAAKLDDFVNFIPSRFGSLFLIYTGALMGYSFKEAISVFESDRGNHLSPNAGHPEAAIAGLLGIQLGGTNVYNGHIIKKPTIGIAKYPINVLDITDTSRIIIMTEVIFLIFTSIVIFFIYFCNYLIQMY